MAFILGMTDEAVYIIGRIWQKDFDMELNTIMQGDALEKLSTLPDESVNCVITSPPYYGLRDYGEDKQIGLEETPEEYIAKLVEVFREIRRVLRGDGVAFLNLGDSYSGSWGNYGGQNRGNGTQREINTGSQIDHKAYEGLDDWRPPTSNTGLLPAKNLMGIPWRVALALQADGWVLRSDIIWAKKNCMPESIRDRPTKAHEYIFLLTKSPRYWYDQDAIREPSVDNEDTFYKKLAKSPHKATKDDPELNKFHRTKAGLGKATYNPSGRNARTVWTADSSAEILSYLADNHPEAYADIADKLSKQSDVWSIASKPFPGSHFAVFPPALVEKCLLAGCPSRVCVECGTPWVRVVERKANNHKSRNDRQIATGGAISGGVGKNFADVIVKTLGFAPTCQCCPLPANKQAYKPGVVLDPFFGSGTTGEVAAKFGRSFLGIELNEDYIDLAWQRLGKAPVALPGIF